MSGGMSHGMRLNLAGVLGLAFGAGAIRAPDGKGWLVREPTVPKGEPTEADRQCIKAAEDKRSARARKRATSAPAPAEPVEQQL
jgi:hypothetical protein